MALLEVAVRGAAARRSHDDPDPTDSLRGVYLSDDYVGWLLDRHATGPADQAAADLAAMRDQLEREADGAEARGYDVRLRRLRRDAALTPLEEDLLVVALAPMLDQRFGQLFGYLNDDVTRRYATVSLATELARHRHPADPRDWMLLRPGSRLVDRGLVEVTDPDQPLPTRSVRVAERVLAFLVGDDTASPEIADLLVEPTLLPLVDPAFARWQEPRSALVRQCPGTDAEVEAATWLASGGPAPLVARLTGPVAEPHDLARQLLRECLLLRRPLVLGPVSRRTLGEGAGRLERFLPADTVVALWTDLDEADRPGESLDRIDLVVPSVEHRTRAWRLLCPEGGLESPELALLGVRHRIGAARIHRALTTAVAADGGLDRASVERGVRAQDGAAMQGQARRITPRRTWSDLVLPDAIHRQLRELTGMVRHRDEVVERWGLGRGDGAGVTALFAGHSGTGKTLAAEVVAGELGVDLYTVDLSRVVDKYVGETEKNLDRLLSAAEGVTG